MQRGTYPLGERIGPLHARGRFQRFVADDELQNDLIRSFESDLIHPLNLCSGHRLKRHALQYQ
jgi:hypothetical protein